MNSPTEPGGGWIGALGQSIRSLADRAIWALARRSAPPGADGFAVGVPSHVGPEGLHVTMGPDGLYQWRADLGSGWRNSAVAYRCIVAIATNAATTPLEVLNEDGEVLPDDLANCWNHAPNDYMSARVLREICWLRLETSGQSFVYMDRGESGLGPVASIHVLDAGWSIQPVIDNTNAERPPFLAGYRVYGANGYVGSLLPQEMLWLRYPDPDDIWSCLAPLRAARFAIDLDDYTRRYQSATMQRGGTPGGVVYLGDVDEDTHKQVAADLRSRHEGVDNAGRHLVLSGPVAAKYERITLTAEEVGYLNTRIQSADEVMLAFGVPRDYLVGGTTYENRTAARTTLWSDTIVPKLQVVASEIDLTTQPEEDRTAHFNTDEVAALQEDANAHVTRVTRLVEMDVVTIDEARQELGYDALPDGGGALTLTPYRARYDAPGVRLVPGKLEGSLS